MLSSTPLVSVVIPARNGAAGLEQAVAAALAQRYQGRLEVVIAVAPSRDETTAIASCLAADPRVRLVDNPKGGTAAGLNAAIAASLGEVIVRCDALATLPPGYVALAVDALRSTGAHNVGGMQVATGESPVQRAVALAVNGRFGSGDARYRIGGAAGPVDTVYLGVYPRAVLDDLGGFDEAFVRNQDAELNLRIRDAGGVVWFEPKLRVEYRPRRSLAALWRQYFEYGWWRRVTVRRHRGSWRLRQMAPPALVAGLIVSAAIAPLAPIAAALLPATYVAAILCASLVQLVRRRDPAALVLPLVYPIIHVGWGLGFLLSRDPPAAGRHG